MDFPKSIGDEVRFDVIDGHIALVTLNRPERRNAIDAATTRALAHLVGEIDRDNRLRVAILASCSDAFFCAGADLKALAEGRAAELSTPDGGFAGLIDAQRRTPWIAVASGPVLAGGFEICLACDLIVASDTAYFGLPEVKRGLFAAGGGAHRLPLVLPRNRAIELLLTGEPIGAEEAHRLGLVARIAPVGELMDAALALARAIAVNAPIAVRETLRLARMTGELPDAELRRVSAEAMDHVFATSDAVEGATAFLERRAPVWQGR